MNVVAVCILLAVLHVVLVYYLANVVRLEYKSLFAALMIANVIIGVYIQSVIPTWKQQLREMIRHGSTEVVAIELLTLVGAFMASGLAGYYIIYKRYGGYGALFTFGGNVVVNALV